MNVVEPGRDDPVAAAESALAEDFGQVDLGRLREQAREDERLAETRRGPLILLDEPS